MDQVLGKQTASGPVILMAQVTSKSRNRLADIRGELFNLIEAIDEPGHPITNEELDHLYRINDQLAEWQPEVEVK